MRGGSVSTRDIIHRLRRFTDKHDVHLLSLSSNTAHLRQRMTLLELAEIIPRLELCKTIYFVCVCVCVTGLCGFREEVTLSSALDDLTYLTHFSSSSSRLMFFHGILFVVVLSREGRPSRRLCDSEFLGCFFSFFPLGVKQRKSAYVNC